MGKIPWSRDRLPVPVFLGFPGGLDGKESACNVEAWVQSLDWGHLLEEGMATPSSILAMGDRRLLVTQFQSCRGSAVALCVTLVCVYVSVFVYVSVCVYVL